MKAVVRTAQITILNPSTKQRRVERGFGLRVVDNGGTVREVPTAEFFTGSHEHATKAASEYKLYDQAV